ncbi:MAG TPA: FAD-dependent oxidoreductase, partial [Clostridiales bacterium]|nr:FAD-dependent oxidoreductase [Clostridiales bacterium]
GIPLKLSTTVVEIHGRERVEGVTIAKVDEKMRPIKGTEEYVECDTLLLSVGLIPENELSKSAGVDINCITGGPDVDEMRETSIRGIFACGNVLQVHDLVDYVTLEAQLAAEGAAEYIKKGEEEKKYAYTVNQNGVRYIVPQKININADRDVDLYFRVCQIYKNAKVVVEIDGETVISRKKPKLAPGEMETVKLKKDMIAKLKEDSLVEISVEESL